MIFTERTITVVNDSATINKPLILYRGDKNIELKITIAESQFKFRNNDASNVIETTDASYAQLVINTPYNSPIFSDVAVTKNGAVIFVITEAMIDEIREVGAYEIQIRLLDDNKQSRASIPPVSNAIEIREPIAIEDGSAVDSNAVNVAKVNRALTTTSAPLEAFDSQGNYIKKTWGDGDPITDAALNKMEAAIDGVNKKIGNVSSQIKEKASKDDLNETIKCGLIKPKNILNMGNATAGVMQINGLNRGSTSYKTSDWIELDAGKYYKICAYDSNKNAVNLSNIKIFYTTGDKSDYYADTSNNTLINGLSDKYYNFMVTSKVNARISYYINNVYYIMISESYLENDNVEPYEEYFESFYGKNIYDYKFINEKQFGLLDKRISLLESNKDIVSTNDFYLKIFKKGICVGDSMTEGYRDTINDEYRAKSYPGYLSKIMNCEITNAGWSGASAQDWYDSYRGTAYNYKDYDFAIIFLGQNKGLTDTLEADTFGGTYNDYASTDTGSYCKIIESMLAANPKIKIFLLKGITGTSSTGISETVTNGVIDKIGEKYSLPVFNVYENKIYNMSDSLYHGSFTCHFTTIGYLTLAKLISQNMCDYISNNLNDYQNF